MSVTVKDLRYKTKDVFKALKRGDRPVITYRGRPVARLVPFTTSEKKYFDAIGFGMWKNHTDLEDVSLWLDEQRKPRHAR